MQGQGTRMVQVRLQCQFDGKGSLLNTTTHSEVLIQGAVGKLDCRILFLLWNRDMYYGSFA